ncbi:MBL fold metallo-hydrolase [Neolewinella aurantiaca]|uniref:MBL fold metallo-hydrolase n=1 Tax=Neolewinella aurantiaca TaxID=2602767 RepID=A0A5C7FEJ7_9BACT|nr:MBL fold metallo-hydrolase [Neolewinella aurantiaca]TXF88665.1 MBL fold metallo-hydrolase [Neolewinella aurantiaca]
MRNLLLLLLALAFFSCGEPAPSSTAEAPDTEAKEPMTKPAEQSAVKMTPVFHSAVVLEYGGKTIFIDPYDKPGKFDGFPAPDMVLITHTHGDHFNKEVLSALDLSKAELFGPEAVTSQAEEFGFAKITTLANGDDAARGDININALAAYNLPESESAPHPPGDFNGYVIELGNERYYFSGDTGPIKEMRALNDIDFAFVCMNLPYTMTMADAADAVLDFKPRVVYPFHYRNKDGTFMDTEKFAAMVNEGDKSIEVRVLDWYK